MRLKDFEAEIYKLIKEDEQYDITCSIKTFYAEVYKEQLKHDRRVRMGTPDPENLKEK